MSFYIYSLLRHVYIKTAIIAVCIIATQFANAQCDAPISLTQVAPSGAVCSPQNVTLRAHYDWSGLNYVSGEFRWYTSAGDANPVQVNYLQAGDFMDADYTFYATAGSTVYVSWFDYDSWCESSRLGYQANVVDLAHFNVQYARECGDGIGRVQVAVDGSSGITYDIYWFNPNTGNYDNIGENSTGYFEIGNFDPSNQYYINVAQPGGCSSGYYQLSFDVAAPWAPTVSGSTTVCEGGSTVLTANGNNYSYQWYDGNGNLLHQGTQYTTSSNLSAGTYNYQVRGLSSGGCVTNPASISTTVNPKPVDGIISASATTIHPGETVTIRGQGGAGEPHYWCSSDGGNTWNVFQDAFVNQPSFSYQFNTVGTYRFHLRNKTSCGFCWDQAGGCTDYPYVDVIVVPWPPVQVSVSPASQQINYSGTASSLVVTGISGADGNYAYQWERSPNSDFTVAFTIPGATSSTYTPENVTGTAWYRVVVTSIVAPAFSTPVAVNVYPKLDAGIVSPRNVTIPAGATPGKLSAGPAAGGACNNSYAYQWQASVDGINFSDIIGAQALTYEPSAGLTAATWYRRMTTTTCNNEKAYTNVCEVNIGTVDVQNTNYIRTRSFMHAGITDEQTAAALGAVAEVKQTTQFLDGLGKIMQTVSRQASNDGKDLVEPVFYDQFGRQSLNYLPYASDAGDGNYRQNPLTELNKFHKVQNAGESFFYGQTVFESSPLNRPLKTMSPGDSWTGSGRGIQHKYETNTKTDDVKIWRVTDNAGDWGTYTMHGGYAIGTLYKNIMVDEHGNQTIEFKDSKGQIILKKVQSGATTDDGTGSGYVNWLCTYYIYDAHNLLRAVVQPHGVQLLIDNNWNITALNGDILNEQCFRYEYDDLNRMTMKKVPGAGEVYMVYDTRDRLVFTQDANLRAQNQWLTTLYDALDRPVITGLTTFAASLADMQLQVTNQTTSSVQSAVDGQNINEYPLPQGATLTSLLTTTFYDNYNSIPSGFSTTSLYSSGYTTYLDASGNEYPEPMTLATSVSGLVTGTKVKVLGEEKYIITCNLYDQKGRVIQVQTQNYTGAMDIVTNQYNFTGQLLRSHIKHQKGGTKPQTYDLATKNRYDDLGRMTAVEENLNGAGWKQIASLTYDALGQLKTKKLSPDFNNSAGLETFTYDYNIRGWLLGANRTYTTNTSATDHYFGFDLGYDKQTIDSIGNYTAAQFNGNIAGTAWKTKGDGQIRKYDFSYDAVNRLTGADFTQYNSGFNKTAGVDFSVSNLTYDANGNILTQAQKGLKLNTSDYIDRLCYNYVANSNKLRNVVDTSNDTQTKLGDFRASQTYMTALGTKTNAATDYSYDVNGNLSADKNKDITSIAYNHLNLPQTITVNGKGSIEYTYDATGVKLKKTVHETGKPDKTSLYLFGTYENDTLQFLPQEEGRIRPVRDGNGTITSFIYDYFLKDHLGNVRMIITEEHQQDVYPAATLEGDINNSSTAVYTEQNYYNINAGNIVDKVYATSITDYPNNNGNPPYNNNPNSTPTALSQKLYKLDGNFGSNIGLGITLKVMAGDSINIFGKSYYYQFGKPRGSTSLPLAVSDLLSMFVTGTPLQAKGLTADGLTSGVPGLATALSSFIQNHPDGGASKPKAYINWVLFDERFNYVTGGFDPVGDANIVKSHNNSTIPTIPVTKNGYIFIYCNNETQTQEVFFDNLQVIHTRGQLLEETHYYPYGLMMAGISSEALEVHYIQNKKKYNGIEFEDDLDLNAYDAQLRMLDPQIGRWWQIDPKIENMEMWSPYASNYDNPIRYSDPLGDEGNLCCGGFIDWLKERGQAELRGAYLVGKAIASTVSTAADNAKNNIRAHRDPFHQIAANPLSLMPEIPGGPLLQGEIMVLNSEVKMEATVADAEASTIKTDVNGKQTDLLSVKNTDKELPQTSNNPKSSDPIVVTKDGVALPKGDKYKIPSNYVENPNRSGSYGVIENGKFVEKLRIDPATPPNMQGPNYSHYHKNGKRPHYSPNGKDKDPGF